MSRFRIDFGQIGVIFQFAPFDEDGLTIGFYTGKREELEFEYFTVAQGVEVDIVFLALMLDNDCDLLAYDPTLGWSSRHTRNCRHDTDLIETTDVCVKDDSIVVEQTRYK